MPTYQYGRISVQSNLKIFRILRRLTKNGKVLDQNVDEDLNGSVEPVLRYCAYGPKSAFAVSVMVPGMHSSEPFIGCVVIECVDRVEEDVIEQDPTECFETKSAESDSFHHGGFLGNEDVHDVNGTQVSHGVASDPLSRV